MIQFELTILDPRLYILPILSRHPASRIDAFSWEPEIWDVWIMFGSSSQKLSNLFWIHGPRSWMCTPLNWPIKRMVINRTTGWRILFVALYNMVKLVTSPMDILLYLVPCLFKTGIIMQFWSKVCQVAGCSCFSE